MSAHTPGPWAYRKGDEKSAPIVQRGAEGGFRVRALTDGRADADALLIAAAPELLEACKKAESALSSIRAAIAKAEGRE